MAINYKDVQIKTFRHLPQEVKSLGWIYSHLERGQFWPLAELLTSLEKSSARLWYAQKTGDWLGFLFAESLGSEEAELYFIYVDPHCRGQGIGAALLGHWLNLLGNVGVKKAFLEVRASNLSAQSLYQRHGFVLVGRRSSYYRDGEDALVYERTLVC